MNFIDQGSTYGRAGACDPRSLLLQGSIWSFFQSTFSFITSSDPIAALLRWQGGHPALPFIDKNWGISLIPQAYKG